MTKAPRRGALRLFTAYSAVRRRGVAGRAGGRRCEIGWWPRSSRPGPGPGRPGPACTGGRCNRPAPPARPDGPRRRPRPARATSLSTALTRSAYSPGVSPAPAGQAPAPQRQQRVLPGAHHPLIGVQPCLGGRRGGAARAHTRVGPAPPVRPARPRAPGPRRSCRGGRGPSGGDASRAVGGGRGHRMRARRGGRGGGDPWVGAVVGVVVGPWWSWSTLEDAEHARRHGRRGGAGGWVRPRPSRHPVPGRPGARRGRPPRSRCRCRRARRWPGGEADGQAGRDAEGTGQHAVGPGELLAEAGLGDREELDQRVGAAGGRRRQGVAELSGPEPVDQGLGLGGRGGCTLDRLVGQLGDDRRLGRAGRGTAPGGGRWTPAAARRAERPN